LEENELALLCIGVALLGMAALIVQARSLEPGEKGIDTLQYADLGSLVEVYGRVSTASTKNGHWFLTVCDRQCIPVFIPSSLAQRINRSVNLHEIKSGHFVRVNGLLKEYNGALELVPMHASSLEVLKP